MVVLLITIFIIMLAFVLVNLVNQKKSKDFYYDMPIYFDTKLEKYHKIINIQKFMIFKKTIYLKYLQIKKKIERIF